MNSGKDLYLNVSTDCRVFTVLLFTWISCGVFLIVQLQLNSMVDVWAGGTAPPCGRKWHCNIPFFAMMKNFLMWCWCFCPRLIVSFFSLGVLKAAGDEDVYGNAFRCVRLSILCTQTLILFPFTELPATQSQLTVSWIYCTFLHIKHNCAYTDKLV